MSNISKELENVNFAQLHVHNYYSIKDGGMSQAKHIQTAKDLGYYAIAETNHGKMYGSYAFWKNCTATKDKNNNPLTPIKPIIGVEAYVSPSLEFLYDKGRKKRYYHMVLLAKNKEGYKELCRSTRVSEKQQFRKKPCLTDSDLERFFSNGNIIALSACLGGEIQQLLLSEQYEEAKKKVLYYKNLFKGEFYMELQNHGIDLEQRIIPIQYKLAKECGVECVITSDSHFAKKEDKKYHDMIICMQFGTTLEKYKNNAYTEHHYLKSKEELFEDFRGYIPDEDIITALSNTGLIADKCDMSFDTTNHYPRYPKLEKGENAPDTLRKWCYEGLEKNVIGYNVFSEKKKEQYKKRLEEELYVIFKTGYADYFLIVSDVLVFYTSIGGYSGLGRGSGVGSLVAYSIGITKVDPIEYNLFFDRFLNLERVSPPDFDLDFDDLRGEVFNYTEKEYGADKTCKIITFGKYGAKSAIRAVGRVLDLPIYFIDKIAKLIGNNPQTSITKALDSTTEFYSVEFEKAYNEESQVKNLVDISTHFEGVIDHTGIHAAACIIGDGELSEYIPMQWDEKAQMWVTQYYKDYNEELGLLKLDYLGLNNLTIIKETARLLNEKYNLDLTHPKIIELALKDKDVISEIYKKGKTKLIFQFESKGMLDTLIRFKPESISDLILLNAVYRPGPIQYIDSIIENKHKPEGIVYEHECLNPILAETYGYPVYQEQIMMIFRTICGYNLGQADLIRRAMGKKEGAILENARKDFIKGYKKLGLSKEKANNFFDEIMDFAKYSFNKSHAAAYTITSLETAYLKFRYPQEYMTACLSYISKTEAYPSVLEECQHLGLTILPPSINNSKELFSPEGDTFIRFGLGCIKNIGKSATEIIEKRPYKTYTDFLVACSSFGCINKGKIESLAYAGVFDDLEVNRATAVTNAEVLNKQKKGAKKVEKDQIDFFSMGAISNDDVIEINKIKEMPYQLKLEKEYEFLFTYVSGHPLDQYRVFCEHFSERNISDIEINDNEMEFDIVGRIKESSIIYRKKDNAPMGKMIIEDLTGRIDAIAFTREFDKYKGLLIKGSVLKFRVKAQVEDNTIDDENSVKKQFIIREVSNLQAIQKVFIKVPTSDTIAKLDDVLKDNVGGTQIMFYVEEDKKLIESEYLVNLDDKLKDILGEENIAV